MTNWEICGVPEPLQLRFVPTMRCNLRCSYCFLPHSLGDEPTMFDDVPPHAWVEAMQHFAQYDVELYLWGGEPFCVPGTFELIAGLSSLPWVLWARVDTNMTYAEQVVRGCSSPKVKLLCSWHPESITYASMLKKVALLGQHDMVGMVNFVASDRNMLYLKEHGLDLGEMISVFGQMGVFLNIAADFGKGDDPEHERFVCRYTPREDWQHIHGHRSSKGVECDAGQSYFTVEHDGRITTCARPGGAAGNYFRGRLRRKSTRCPHGYCRSIVSYSHRKDNTFASRRHLEDYIARCREHRESVGL